MKCYNFAVKNYFLRNRRIITYDITFNHKALSSNLFKCYPGLNKL